jgi:hypothetical protein
MRVEGGAESMSSDKIIVDDAIRSATDLVKSLELLTGLYSRKRPRNFDPGFMEAEADSICREARQLVNSLRDLEGRIGDAS